MHQKKVDTDITCISTARITGVECRVMMDNIMGIPCSDKIGLDGTCDVNWIRGRFGPYVHVWCVDGVPSFCYCCNFRPDIVAICNLTYVAI